MEQQCFSSLKNQKKLLLNFYKILWASYKNGNAKDCKFVKQFWEWIKKICSNIINGTSIEPSLCDYPDFILVTGNIAVTRTIAAAGDNPVQRNQPLTAGKQVAFKNYAPLKDSRTEINDMFVDYADFISITMSMYNLIEYRDNYSDILGSLWGFKRYEIVNNVNVTNDDNAPSFKYKVDITGGTGTDGTKNWVKIAVPLKYLSNFWRSLEIPLINCKFELSLRWIQNFLLTTATIGANADATGTDSATFKINDAKIYVPVVTLSTEDRAKLGKDQRFKRSVYWNKYKVIDNKVAAITRANREKT